MTPFRSTPAGYVATWEPVERQVLARVARDVAELLRTDAGLPEDATDVDVAFTGVARMPRDPAVQRLLPDAHRDDAEVAAEFRHLTQTDLAAGKVNRLLAFARTVDPYGQDSDDLAAAAPGEAEPGAGRSDADALDIDAADVGVPAATGAETDDDQVLVAREAASDFAGALTDVRLVIAERLALDDDDAVERLHHEILAGSVDGADGGADDDAEQRFYWGGVFVAAGFAQESLMDELLAELRARRAGS